MKSFEEKGIIFRPSFMEDPVLPQGALKCHYFSALSAGAGTGPATSEHRNRRRQWNGASRNQGN